MHVNCYYFEKKMTREIDPYIVILKWKSLEIFNKKSLK